MSEKKRSVAIAFYFQAYINRLLVISLSCSVQLTSQAQTRIDIPADDHWSMKLIAELEIMSDEERQWSAESLFVASEDLFRSNAVDAKPQLHNYWARFNLVNTAAHEQWVSFESYYWDYIRLYFRDSTGRTSLVPMGVLSRPYNNTFLLQPQMEYEVLANFESSGKFRREDNINLVIKPTLPALENRTFTHYMDGITFGIMFGLALYNLFLFISLRDNTYFWYTLYILSFALSFATLFSSAPPKWTQFFTSDYPLFAFYEKKISDPVIWISYVNFVRKFLATKDRHQTWDKVLKICIVAIILQFLLNVTDIYHSSGITRVLTWNIPVVLCIILALISYFKGYTKAKFFILGQIILMVGFAITFMHYAGSDIIFFLPETAFFNYFRDPSSTFVFGAAESIVFSFALADKYNRLQQDNVRIKFEKEKEKQDMLASQNEMLEQRVSEQTQELRQSLENLQTTQAQLIQAEKMAALGTLTAGIAHEIKNPLNFIYNFSDINVQLLQELIADDRTVANDDQSNKESQILETLKNNSTRIHHHGKRMDEIVKGMLQHSRTGTTHYEEVNINTLCEESLRMAYHGYRATEKSFDVKCITDYSNYLPPIRVIAQDLGRVILNITNNAFYSMNEKRRALNGSSEDLVNYQPEIKLTTAESLQDIVITIADNGSGIPDHIIDQVFQPFFTTKPTGQGTGLGLSMAFDIITKGHGGSLNVRSKEGLGTEFEIVLPIKPKG